MEVGDWGLGSGLILFRVWGLSSLGLRPRSQGLGLEGMPIQRLLLG